MLDTSWLPIVYVSRLTLWPAFVSSRSTYVAAASNAENFPRWRGPISPARQSTWRVRFSINLGSVVGRMPVTGDPRNMGRDFAPTTRLNGHGECLKCVIRNKLKQL